MGRGPAEGWGSAEEEDGVIVVQRTEELRR